MKKLILLFVVLPLLTSPLAAVADELDTPAVPKPGELIVEVNGVVCSICAKGLKKNLAKLYMHLTGTLESVDGKWLLSEKAGPNKFGLANAPNGLAKGNAVTARVMITAKTLAKAKPGAVVEVEVDEIATAR